MEGAHLAFPAAAVLYVSTLEAEAESKGGSGTPKKWDFDQLAHEKAEKLRTVRQNFPEFSQVFETENSIQKAQWGTILERVEGAGVFALHSVNKYCPTNTTSCTQ